MDSALKDMGISSKKDKHSFLNDVFGYTDDVYIRGLCDCKDQDEFCVLLDSFRPVWEDREANLIGRKSKKVFT